MTNDDGSVFAMGSRFDALVRGEEADPELRSFLDGVPGVTLPGAAAPVAAPAPVFAAEPVAAPTPPPYVAPAAPVASAPEPAPLTAATASYFDPPAVDVPSTRRAAPASASAPAPAPAPAAPATRSADVEPLLHAQHAYVDPEFVAAVRAVLDLGASDLHLVAESTPVVRVDGELKSVAGSTIWDAARVRRVVETIVSDEQMRAFETALELDLAYAVGDIARFRVNIFQDQRGLGAALRLIPTQIKSVAQLGLPPELIDLARLPRGLVLVCGPTGSGKSTTLAAIIDKANSSRAAHIVTVEDPIEFLHHHKRGIINQREVGADTHSFSEALKHSLRQDPDIILVGEMRDLETISTALTAAETGHLVFATLHTQDAGQTIDRIIDVYPAHQQAQVRTQLAATLRAVVVQTLIRRSSGRGRAVATEVMFSTPAIQALVRAGKTHQLRTAIQAGNSIGMHTLDQDLARLVLSGQIEHSQAVELAQDVTEFEQLVRNRGLASAPADSVVPEGTRQVTGGA
ncbi:type IV pilus twitching motility protein PilT [Microbacterium sp. NPDC058021]|uniref:type IV pilus twitching motility protein PilT n=1 Tax=Microbacterium sp. NPDC058021 TaxID=3346306 RepID=UPI0036DDB6D2